jgi:hypothetical protein
MTKERWPEEVAFDLSISIRNCMAYLWRNEIQFHIKTAVHTTLPTIIFIKPFLRGSGDAG